MTSTSISVNSLDEVLAKLEIIVRSIKNSDRIGYFFAAQGIIKLRQRSKRALKWTIRRRGKISLNSMFNLLISVFLHWSNGSKESQFQNLEDSI